VSAIRPAGAKSSLLRLDAALKGPLFAVCKVYDIIAVGSVAFDSIATPSGRVENVVGGSATFFALARESFITDVRVVAIVARLYRRHESILKNRGVDTRGNRQCKRKTFAGAAISGKLNEARPTSLISTYSKNSSQIQRSTKTQNSCSWKYSTNAAICGSPRTLRSKLTGGDTMTSDPGAYEELVKLFVW